MLPSLNKIFEDMKVKLHEHKTENIPEAVSIDSNDLYLENCGVYEGRNIRGRWLCAINDMYSKSAVQVTPNERHMFKTVMQSPSTFDRQGFCCFV